MLHDTRAQLPLIEIAIEPRAKADQDKLGIALAKLAAEDPSFRVTTDHESSQTIMKGTSELHLDSKLDLLRLRDKIDVRIGTPQVAFLERPTRPAVAEYTHKQIQGPKGEFAAVKLAIAPNEPGCGYQFESRFVGGAVPEEYIPGVEKGLAGVLSCGVVAGFPVTDVKVALIDGKYHDIDSSPRAFEIASRAAFREALQKAVSVVIEPIMKVDLVAPEAYLASVIGDLERRRGQIQSREMRGDVTVISALVPLINLFGYAGTLRVMSDGRAALTMQFDHYAPTPSPDDNPPFRPATGMRA